MRAAHNQNNKQLTRALSLSSAPSLLISTGMKECEKERASWQQHTHTPIHPYRGQNKGAALLVGFLGKSKTSQELGPAIPSYDLGHPKFRVLPSGSQLCVCTFDLWDSASVFPIFCAYTHTRTQRWGRNCSCPQKPESRGVRTHTPTTHSARRRIDDAHTRTHKAAT